MSGEVVGASHNWAAIIIGLTGVGACLCRSGRCVAVGGVAGLGLCSFYVLHLTFLDPFFWNLVDENDQYAQMMTFSFHFLPANYGIEPTFQPHLITGSVVDRLAAAAYFMSRGWWLCLLGSLLLLGGSFTMAGWQTIRWMTMTMLVIFGGLGIVFSTGISAQYPQARGDGYMARGRFAEAIQQYEAAQQFDSQLARSEQFHLRLGEAYYHLGMSSHPPALFYLGSVSAQQKQADAAVTNYLLAVEGAPAPLAEIISRRMAWTYAIMGLVHYRKGHITQATALWEKASAFDPDQFMATYFLTKAYFDQGRYGQSIAMGRSLLGRCRNQLVNANLHANIGDSYWKLRDYTSARKAYEAAQQLDPFANFRIIKSLGGT
jgi:hypothetical protein